MAIRVYESPQMQMARNKAAKRLKTLVGATVPSEAWDSFENTINEWAFGYALRAVNGDANYPKVLRLLYSPKHSWFGMDVPGSHGIGGDNPDTVYSIIPVDPYSRFEIRGKCQSDSIDAPFQLVSNLSLSATLDILEWKDVVIGTDGSFVVTIGPEAADYRSNHLQSTRDARYLLIRDTQGDWLESPNTYTVERLDAPFAPPLAFERVVERAEMFTVSEVAASYFWMAMVVNLDVNVFTPAFITGEVGGMATARMSMARLKLAEDEAYVLNINDGNKASYRGLVLMNFWQHSVDCGSRLTSLSNAQCSVDHDGSTTVVISANDPGVSNWVDTAGISQPRIMLRWQDLPEDKQTVAEADWVKGKIVHLDELEDVLGPGVERISFQARKDQLNQRQRAFASRYLDH